MFVGKSLIKISENKSTRTHVCILTNFNTVNSTISLALNNISLVTFREILAKMCHLTFGLVTLTKKPLVNGHEHRDRGRDRGRGRGTAVLLKNVITYLAVRNIPVPCPAWLEHKYRKMVRHLVSFNWNKRLKAQLLPDLSDCTHHTLLGYTGYTGYTHSRRSLVAGPSSPSSGHKLSNIHWNCSPLLVTTSASRSFSPICSTNSTLTQTSVLVFTITSVK